jgi:hypothetical protein
MKLLNHPLLRKYFGAPVPGESIPTERARMAYRILEAMQEPIRQEDLFLMMHDAHPMMAVHLDKALSNLVLLDIHSHYLRLPEPFQKK